VPKTDSTRNSIIVRKKPQNAILACFEDTTFTNKDYESESHYSIVIASGFNGDYEFVVMDETGREIFSTTKENEHFTHTKKRGKVKTERLEYTWQIRLKSSAGNSYAADGTFIVYRVIPW